MTTIYLAGPDVFFADAAEAGRAKKELCAKYGFEGLFPLDAELAQEESADLSTRIFRANIDGIRRCDAVVANLTPFRGVSADPGTVFEIAYARGLQIPKPVFAYTNVPDSLFTRVTATFGLAPGHAADRRDFAGDGMVVENFGLADNLMIVEAIRLQGWDMVSHTASTHDVLSSLQGFEACLTQARAHFAKVQPVYAA